MSESSTGGGVMVAYIRQEIDKATQPLHQRIEKLERQLVVLTPVVPQSRSLLQCLGFHQKEGHHERS